MRSNLREKSIWCEDFVRESWNRPRSSVQLKYGVFSCVKGDRESDALAALTRVVPPKSFRSLVRDQRAFFYCKKSRQDPYGKSDP